MPLGAPVLPEVNVELRAACRVVRAPCGAAAAAERERAAVAQFVPLVRAESREGRHRGGDQQSREVVDREQMVHLRGREEPRNRNGHHAQVLQGQVGDRPVRGIVGEQSHERARVQVRSQSCRQRVDPLQQRGAIQDEAIRIAKRGAGPNPRSEAAHGRRRCPRT